MQRPVWLSCENTPGAGSAATHLTVRGHREPR